MEVLLGDVATIAPLSSFDVSVLVCVPSLYVLMNPRLRGVGVHLEHVGINKCLSVPEIYVYSSRARKATRVPDRLRMIEFSFARVSSAASLAHTSGELA